MEFLVDFTEQGLRFCSAEDLVQAVADAATAKMEALNSITQDSRKQVQADEIPKMSTSTYIL